MHPLAKCLCSPLISGLDRFEVRWCIHRTRLIRITSRQVEGLNTHSSTCISNKERENMRMRKVCVCVREIEPEKDRKILWKTSFGGGGPLVVCIMYMRPEAYSVLGSTIELSNIFNFFFSNSWNNSCKEFSQNYINQINRPGSPVQKIYHKKIPFMKKHEIKVYIRSIRKEKNWPDIGNIYTRLFKAAAQIVA